MHIRPSMSRLIVIAPAIMRNTGCALSLPLYIRWRLVARCAFRSGLAFIANTTRSLLRNRWSTTFKLIAIERKMCIACIWRKI